MVYSSVRNVIVVYASMSIGNGIVEHFMLV